MNYMEVALELLGVGMVSVFVILALVVILGNLIIMFVNKFLPELGKVAAKKAEVIVLEVSPKKRAVILSVVNKVTNGTAHVTGIEKA